MMYPGNTNHPVKGIKAWLLLWTVAFSINSWQAFCQEDCKKGFSDTTTPLFSPINTLSLPLIVQMFLHKKGIYYIGDLVTKTEKELLATFPSHPLSDEIQAWLSKRKLHLGMNASWPITRRQIKQQKKREIHKGTRRTTKGHQGVGG